MLIEQIQKQNEDEAALRNFTQTIFGTRIINNTVVKHLRLEIFMFYNALHTREAYYSDVIETEYSKIMDKMEAVRYQAYPMRECGEMCALLYQIKYWFDIKCKTNKRKHTFHKKIESFRQELSWLSRSKIKDYLTLFDTLGIIYRVPTYDEGYIYSLNIENNLVKTMYIIDAMTKYYNKYNKDDEGFKIKMLDIKEPDFYPFIDNKVVRHCYNTKTLPWLMINYPLVDGQLPPGRSSTTPWLTVTPHTKTTAKIKPKNNQKLSRNSNSASLNNSKLLHSSIETDSNISSGKQTVIDSSIIPKKAVVLPDSSLPKLNGDSSVLKLVNAKWESLSVKRKKEVEKLFIPAWRKKRKGAYDFIGRPDDNPYDKAEIWFDGLNVKDKTVVQAFQDDMFPPSSRIAKDKSYKISLIDAHTVQDNFLQFCRQNELI